MRIRQMIPQPVFMAEGSGGGGSDALMERLRLELDQAKEATRKAQGDLQAAMTEHAGALTTLKREHGQALAALKTEHDGRVTELTTAHTAALEAAKAEGQTALTEAQKASNGRMITLALQSEAKAAGLLDLDALKLLDPAKLEKLKIGDDGTVTGVKELVTEFKTAKPFAFGTGNTSSGQQPPSSEPPKQKHARDMTEAEFEAANNAKAWRSAA